MAYLYKSLVFVGLELARECAFWRTWQIVTGTGHSLFAIDKHSPRRVQGLIVPGPISTHGAGPTRGARVATRQQDKPSSPGLAAVKRGFSATRFRIDTLANAGATRHCRMIRNKK